MGGKGGPATDVEGLRDKNRGSVSVSLRKFWIQCSTTRVATEGDEFHFGFE